jgi:uncharacterized protein YidB (DUF937 family)
LPDLVDKLTPQGRVPANAGDVPMDELSRLSGQIH